MTSAFPAFDPASPQAQAIQDLFVQVLILSAVIFAIVSGLILVAIYRGHKRAALPDQNFGSEKAEIFWMVGPILIVIWLTLVSAKLVLTLNAMPAAHPDDPDDKTKADLVVRGHQWWWEVQYVDANVVGANEVHMPVGRRLRLRLESADVIHCFWVPRLGRKMDMIPGRDNYMWLEASEPGVYQGRCAEFCGAQHARMQFKVYVHTEDDYDSWLESHKTTTQPPSPETLAADGHQLFMTMTCSQCHTIDGTEATADFAPSLTHLASRKEIGAGVLENSPENLRRWLANPAAFKPGCKMPNFKLNDRQLDQLVAYLETLK